MGKGGYKVMLVKVNINKKRENVTVFSVTKNILKYSYLYIHF